MESVNESVKDLIVDVRPKEVHIALMEDSKLMELNSESSTGHKFAVGDVYLGKVKKVMPALNAAFVDIGDEKEAFIHYLDLGLYFGAFDKFVRDLNPNVNAKDFYSRIGIGPVLEKEGRIENVLKKDQSKINLLESPENKEFFIKEAVQKLTNMIGEMDNIFQSVKE